MAPIPFHSTGLAWTGRWSRIGQRLLCLLGRAGEPVCPLTFGHGRSFQLFRLGNVVAACYREIKSLLVAEPQNPPRH